MKKQTKRILSLFFALLMVITLLPGETAKAACAHTYKMICIKPATATSSGETVYRCTKCNATMNRATVAAHSHTYKTVSTVEATCTKAGRAEYMCTFTNCYYTISATIPAKPHRWNISAATCVTPKKCLDCGTVGQYATGKHSYKTVTVQKATCTKNGVAATQCTVCKQYVSASFHDIKATGHTWQLVTAAGFQKYTRDEKNVYKCTKCAAQKEEVVFPALAKQADNCAKWKKYFSEFYSAEKLCHYFSHSGGNKDNADGDHNDVDWIMWTPDVDTQINNFHSTGYTVVLRPKNKELALALALISIDAALNPCIGYNADQHGTYIKQLRSSKVNWTPSLIGVNCEQDCSSGVTANVKAAGYHLGITELQSLDDVITTPYIVGKLMDTQQFTKLVFNNNIDVRNLLPGDILWHQCTLSNGKKHGHVIVNVSVGANMKKAWYNDPVIASFNLLK